MNQPQVMPLARKALTDRITVSVQTWSQKRYNKITKTDKTAVVPDACSGSGSELHAYLAHLPPGYGPSTGEARRSRSRYDRHWTPNPSPAHPSWLLPRHWSGFQPIRSTAGGEGHGRTLESSPPFQGRKARAASLPACGRLPCQLHSDSLVGTPGRQM